MKHRRIVVTKHGGPDVLQMIEEDRPEPAAGEVRVKVLAAGVSAYDLMSRQSGSLPGTPRVPFTPGTDIVGEVDERGPGTPTVNVGDVVAAATFSGGAIGGYAEYICLPEADVVLVPSGVTPEDAVCLVVNYLTAYTALHHAAHIKPGERILVHGAAGGVGSALLQLGRLVDLEMFGTASAHNHDVVTRLGATPIDYHAEDFVEGIRRLTGDGVDAVFDCIGGAGQVWRSYRALRKGGRLVWFGMAATKTRGLWIIPPTLLTLMFLKILPDGKRAPSMPDLDKDPMRYRETLTTLLDLLAAGKLDPVVAEKIPLEEVSRAHALLEAGRYAGKVVLSP